MILSKGDTILFIGDSITDCNRNRATNIYAWAPLQHGNGYVSDVEAELVCEYTDLQIRVLNMGISDNTIRDLKERWQSDVLDWKPDWVFVFIGINDVWKHFQYPNVTDLWVQPEEYEQAYRGLIEQTVPHVKGMILITPYYMEPNRQDPMRVRMEQFSDIVRRLAGEYGLRMIDMQAAWDKFLEKATNHQISYDRVHPNHIGHVYIAKQIMKMLENED